MDGYTIFHTEAFILHTSPHGESNRTAIAFTESHGVVPLFAKSVRVSSSKLKSLVYPYRYASVSFVHGKRYVLIGGKVIDPFITMWESQKHKEVFVRTLRLIRALLPVYTAEPYIFSILRSYAHLLKNKKDPQYTSTCAEYLILRELGIAEEISWVPVHNTEETISLCTNNTNYFAEIEQKRNYALSQLNLSRTRTSIHTLQ
ncbi:MAG: DNA repair protein RecO [Alphaproteobacteria bacterium]|nr:DNA repair protein RecO [Alphaproteobacteria bacterium]